jgi:RNA polymerase sigma factor (sigma-70 family)
VGCRRHPRCTLPAVACARQRGARKHRIRPHAGPHAAPGTVWVTACNRNGRCRHPSQVSATTATPVWQAAGKSAYAADLRPFAGAPALASAAAPLMTAPSHPADLHLARTAAAGDPVARAELGGRLAIVERLCQARNLRAGRPLRAEDVTDIAQEVRLRVWQRLGDYAGTAPLEAWVFAFVEFLMRNAVRKQHRRPEAQPFEEGSVAAVPSPGAVFHDDVHGCLDRLAALDQQIVRAKFFDGLTLDETARRLGLNLNTVKSRYTRALQQLHGCLERHATQQGGP